MPTRAAVWATCVAILSCSWLGCRDDAVLEVDKPDAPDMQALIAAYATPTAALSQPVLDEIIALVPGRLEAYDTVAIEALITAATRALMQVQVPGAAGTSGMATLEVRGDGYVVATRICDGWGAVPAPDPSHGFAQLTLGFSQGKVDPVIWGTLRSCQYLIGMRRVLLNGVETDRKRGDLRMFVGAGLSLAQFANFRGQVLVDAAASLSVDGRELIGRIDFRVDLTTRAVELRIPVLSGHVIAGIGAERGAAIQLRASNGSFSCDLSDKRCVGPGGSVVGGT